jgi:hypothetical protein
LQEGVVLSAEVKNLDGMLLLPAGCTLAAKHIEMLQAWGINEVQVDTADGVSEPADPLARLTPQETQRLTEETRGLFWHLDEANPVQQEIFNLILQRRARKLHG